jgi:hypothetical protein
MAWSATVTEVGRHPNPNTDSDFVFVSLGAELGSRQVLVPKGTYRLGDRVIYVENGRLTDDCHVEAMRGAVAKETEVEGCVSQGLLLEGILVPPDNGINVCSSAGFVEDDAYRLTREFMTQHKGEKMVVMVYPTGAKRFVLDDTYVGEDPFLIRLLTRMKDPKRQWTRLWGWQPDDDRFTIEGGWGKERFVDIPRDELVDIVNDFYEDMRLVHTIRTFGELPISERSYNGLKRAVHRKMRLTRQHPPYNVTLKVAAESIGTLEVPVYEPEPASAYV